MVDFSPIMQHLGPLMLVAARLLGLFFFSPVLSSILIPRQYKAMLAMGLALAIYPMLPPELHAIPPVSLVGLAFVLVAEVIIGLFIGMIASLPLFGAQMAGYLMGYKMGLGLAQAYDPLTEANNSVLDQLLYMMALTCFVLAGGLDSVFLAVLRTFETVPMGAVGPGAAPLGLFIAVLNASTELAIRIAMPVLVALSLLLVAIGFVMKTMPQINVMSAGFAMKILAGLMMLAAAIFMAADLVVLDIEQASRVVLEWADSIGRGGGTHG